MPINLEASNIISIIYNHVDILIYLILMIVIPLIILKIVLRSLKEFNDKQGSISSNSLHTWNKILTYITYIVIFAGILDIFGLDLRSLLVSLGLVSVAGSLAAKDTLSNIISGVTILLEHKFQKNDIIEIDGYKGQVVDINLRSVMLYSNNSYITIPNTLFSTKSFVNHTKNDCYIVKFAITFKNSYDVNDKIESIKSILKNSDIIMHDPQPKVFIQSITTSGVELKINVAIDDPLNDSHIQSELLKTFK
ncbi:MAG: mechanosensitive ion channel family protein, partial [Methanosphaera sp.]|nr:mechanosensitive ion channel family protein [Methanosphaera sp.]